MSKRNLTLLTDLYELTMMQGYFYAKDANETVIFDAFYRDNPDGNGFAIAAGLEQVIEYIEDLHFDPEDIDYLRSTGIFKEDFLEYLADFKFTGDHGRPGSVDACVRSLGPAETKFHDSVASGRMDDAGGLGGDEALVVDDV